MASDPLLRVRVALCHTERGLTPSGRRAWCWQGRTPRGDTRRGEHTSPLSGCVQTRPVPATVGDHRGGQRPPGLPTTCVLGRQTLPLSAPPRDTGARRGRHSGGARRSVKRGRWQSGAHLNTGRPATLPGPTQTTWSAHALCPPSSVADAGGRVQPRRAGVRPGPPRRRLCSPGTPRGLSHAPPGAPTRIFVVRNVPLNKAL